MLFKMHTHKALFPKSIPQIADTQINKTKKHEISDLLDIHISYDTVQQQR